MQLSPVGCCRSRVLSVTLESPMLLFVCDCLVFMTVGQSGSCGTVKRSSTNQKPQRNNTCSAEMVVVPVDAAVFNCYL